MKMLKLVAALLCCAVSASSLHAQSFTFNCNRDTTIGLCQGPNCFTLKAIIPDIHISSAAYTVNPIGSTPSSCFPIYVQPNDPTGDTTSLTLDDIYSNVINISFPFPFYGTVYNNLIASPNGVVSFDVSKANGFAHYGILRDVNILSATAGTPENLPSSLYDAALIMGPYHDLNPAYPTSPTRIVQRKTIGVAPHRKWILSFYKMPLYFVSGGCNLLIENTHQIVLYESTGIIEVLVYSSEPCVGWNDGRAMIGIQNFAKNQALMVNGRKASDPPWGTPGMNEAYRFVPSSGASLFRRVELRSPSGTLLSTGTTANMGNGKLEASFPNICPPVGVTTTYIVRSVYTKFDDPLTEVYGTDTIRVTKSNSPDLNATATTTNTNCFSSTGTITVSVPPGTANPPYTYVLDGGTPVTGPSPYTFTNVSAGPHTVMVGESTFFTCSSTISVNIAKNNDLLSNSSSTATDCVAVGTGSITLTPTNGTGPYTFKLDGGLAVPGTVPFTFSGVYWGPHNVIVYDATGCQTSVMVVDVPIGPGVTANNNSTIASCSSVANASITATTLTGIAPFTWQLDGGTVQSGASPHTFTNVSSGIHNVTIIDAAGCGNNYSVNVAAGPGVNGTTSTTQASCAGINNGSITANATLGSGPFTFQLDGGTFQSGPNSHVFTNISGGSHTVVIKDNVGCTKSFNVTILNGPGPNVSGFSSATSCNGSTDGVITATATNGTGPYMFSLDGATAVGGANPHTFSNLTPGNHTIIITDAVGCMSNTVTVNVTAGPALTTSILKTDVQCNGGNTGSITINQPGLGVAPYQYSLNGTTWQSSNSFTNLIAGSYTVYYRSSNGCFGSQNVTITQPATLTAATNITPVRCHGESNGIIIVNPSGGVGPYQYSIDAGASWQVNNNFNVPAGNYSIIIKDANGCSTTRNIIVTEPALLRASSTNLNATCDGGNNGQIQVNPLGGNGGYSYSLDGSHFQSSNLFNVAPGNYTVTVKDALGCDTSFNTTVGLTFNLFLNHLTDVTICDGTSTQLQITSNASVYTWTPSTGLNNANIPNPIVSPSTTTQYNLTAVLGRCTLKDSLIVHVNSAPIPDAGPDGDICYGRSYTLLGSGGVQYSWTPAIYLNSTSGANPVATPSRTTTYTLSVVDAYGCHSLVTDDVKVVVSKPMRVEMYPFDTVGYPGQTIQLLAVSEGISYTWSPAVRISNTSIPNPVITVGNIGDDIVYEVVGTTVDGCKGEGYVHVKVSRGPDIYMPTAFTPNHDGKNDMFTPIPVGIRSLNYFRVFNRWGQLIFSTTSENKGWDGTIGGVEQPTGVYTWLVEGISHDNRLIRKKGIVTLIR